MAQIFVNNFQTTLGSSLASGVTSLTMASGYGTKMPAIASPDFMLLTLEEGTNVEIVKVTAHTSNSDTCTIAREQESTTSPGSFSTSAKVEGRITKGGISQILRNHSIQTVASSATVTPNADTDDEVVITAQAAGLTLANPSGTASQGQPLIVRIKDNGTARSISYGTQYRDMGNTRPTTTVVGKTLYLGFKFNSTDTKWDLVALAQET